MSQRHSFGSALSSLPSPTPTQRIYLADKRAPWIQDTKLAFPDYKYDQQALTACLAKRWKDRPHAIALLERLHAAVGVNERHVALPIEKYGTLANFGEANDVFIRVGTELASRALADAVSHAGLTLQDVDAVFFTTVTGIAAPTIDARVINQLGLRRDVKRTPMFGLGCLGGAAGLARASDYLRAFPNHVAVLLSVELCSLTLQDDFSVANVIAAGLFGDGAAAVVLVGSERATQKRVTPMSVSSLVTGRARPRARVVDTRSAFFYDTERVMGWDVGAAGFKVVLSADVPKIAKERLPNEIDAFLTDHGLSRNDIRRWVCHPGGPKVISAIEEALELPSDALSITRESLASVGNLSSASVLHVLEQTQLRAERGDLGILLAMGPGFCAELVLLEWQ